MKTIALGTDHAGFTLKQAVKAHLDSKEVKVVDFGTDGEASVDYPDFIRPAAESVARHQADLGVVFGGSGNGEAMTANKVQGIRCALCWDTWSARLAREHNDANMISLPGRAVSEEEAVRIVDTWLEATFQAGRHLRRIRKIERT
jgi:ribose 5-phosphate isomerase B